MTNRRYVGKVRRKGNKTLLPQLEAVCDICGKTTRVQMPWFNDVDVCGKCQWPLGKLICHSRCGGCPNYVMDTGGCGYPIKKYLKKIRKKITGQVDAVGWFK